MPYFCADEIEIDPENYLCQCSDDNKDELRQHLLSEEEDIDMSTIIHTWGPRFDVPDINITPEEFLDECSAGELEDLMDELEGMTAYSNRYGTTSGFSIFDQIPRGYGYQKFVHILTHLAQSWDFISKEDEEKIIEITKKYGVV